MNLIDISEFDAGQVTSRLRQIVEEDSYGERRGRLCEIAIILYETVMGYNAKKENKLDTFMNLVERMALCENRFQRKLYYHWILYRMVHIFDIIKDCDETFGW